MQNIMVFENVTIDGYFAGPHGEIDWFKVIQPDDEWDAFSHRQAAGGATLMFGRTTYEMMQRYWPTPEARTADPEFARIMTTSPKIVISQSLNDVEEGPHWRDIRLLREITEEKILALKQEEDIVILGSGSIVQQLANLDLIDEYFLVVVPIILGNGKPLFRDVKLTNLKLVEARSFRNGLVLLHYHR
jgi:dihydrofolate reductase